MGGEFLTQKITRREFIRDAAFVAGGVVLAGIFAACAEKPPAAEERNEKNQVLVHKIEEILGINPTMDRDTLKKKLTEKSKEGHLTIQGVGTVTDSHGEKLPIIGYVTSPEGKQVPFIVGSNGEPMVIGDHQAIFNYPDVLSGTPGPKTYAGGKGQLVVYFTDPNSQKEFDDSAKTITHSLEEMSLWFNKPFRLHMVYLREDKRPALMQDLTGSNDSRLVLKPGVQAQYYPRPILEGSQSAPLTSHDLLFSLQHIQNFGPAIYGLTVEEALVAHIANEIGNTTPYDYDGTIPPQDFTEDVSTYLMMLLALNEHYRQTIIGPDWKGLTNPIVNRMNKIAVRR